MNPKCSQVNREICIRFDVEEKYKIGQVRRSHMGCHAGGLRKLTENSDVNSGVPLNRRQDSMRTSHLLRR